MGFIVWIWFNLPFAAGGGWQLVRHIIAPCSKDKLRNMTGNDITWLFACLAANVSSRLKTHPYATARTEAMMICQWVHRAHDIWAAERMFTSKRAVDSGQLHNRLMLCVFPSSSPTESVPSAVSHRCKMSVSASLLFASLYPVCTFSSAAIVQGPASHSCAFPPFFFWFCKPHLCFRVCDDAPDLSCCNIFFFFF